jgi:hypothetical protein
MSSAQRTLITAVGLLSAASSTMGGVQIRTQELPWAALGGVYDTQIVTVPDGRCPRSDVGVSVMQGRLPRGIELWGDRLQGTPRELGSFPLRIRAMNGCQTAATKDLVLVVTGKPILRVAPDELVFDYVVGGSSPRPQSILVASTWPHLPYSVTAESAKWLNVTVTEGLTPERDAALSSDSVWVRVSPQGLAPGAYKASVTFSVWLGANAPVVPITLRIRSAQ